MLTFFVFQARQFDSTSIIDQREPDAVDLIHQKDINITIVSKYVSLPDVFSTPTQIPASNRYRPMVLVDSRYHHSRLHG